MIYFTTFTLGCIILCGHKVHICYAEMTLVMFIFLLDFHMQAVWIEKFL